MRRLIRPALFTVASVAAVVGFLAVGRMSPAPLAWSDIGGWLDRAEPVDAFSEMARWVGLVLAAYVAVVSFAALMAESASLVHMPRLHRWLSRLVGAVALPALRHRLLEATAVATMTASSLQGASVGAVDSVMAAPALAVDQASTTPMLRGEFHGFGAQPTAVPAQATEAMYTVRAGDTLWDIVRDHYGRAEAAMVDAVAAANPTIVDPDLILVGWKITLPELDVAEPVDVSPRTVDGEATWSVVGVREGDTLWDIVDEHYGNATAELVWATVEANPEIDDPAVILPGQLIMLPPSGVTETDLSAESPPEPVEVDLPPPTMTPPTPEPEDGPSPTVASQPAERTSAAEPTPPVLNRLPTVPPSSALPSPTTMATASPPVADGSQLTSEDSVVGDDIDEPAGPSLAQLIGWTGGAGLAAALLGLTARRRRSRPTVERHRRPSERAVQLGVALHETENLATVEWAAVALGALAGQLHPRPGEPTPVPRLLRLDGDLVELVWDVPNPDVCTPWRTQDGGWSWTLERPTELRATDAPSPCPGLVTIGKRDEADVLLNLESCGAIAVTGDSDATASLVESMALELAASSFSDAPTVLLVGMASVPAAPEHARAVSVDEALGWMRDRNDSATALLAHRRLTSLFALRARSRPQDSHEPVIVIVDPSDVDEVLLAEMIELANGDLGTVLVVTGPCPSLTWQLECAGGVVTVQPLALAMDSVGVSEDIDCLIEEFVPPAELDQDEPEGVEELDADKVHAVLADHVVIAQERLPSTASATAVESTEWDVELKVLGQVRCVGSKEPLTPTELHLAIYLAFNRNGANSDTIATMVWPNGAAQRTITNTMASLRRKLGAGSDGEMLFPLGRDSQYLYKLSPRVTTDWDRFIELARQAEESPPDQAVDLLDQALDLIDGPPFRASTGYSWAYSDGTASLICETVALVARRCVDLHLDRAEFLAAGTAAYNGTRTIDDAADDPLVKRVADALRSSGQDSNARTLLERAAAGTAPTGRG
jgi:nucleoid-associated protein YgaU